MRLTFNDIEHRLALTLSKLHSLGGKYPHDKTLNGFCTPLPLVRDDIPHCITCKLGRFDFITNARSQRWNIKRFSVGKKQGSSFLNRNKIQRNGQKPSCHSCPPRTTLCCFNPLSVLQRRGKYYYIRVCFL